MSEAPPPQNVVEKQGEAPKTPTKGAESGPKLSIPELRDKLTDATLNGKADEGAHIYAKIQEARADYATRTRAEAKSLALEVGIVNGAEAQAKIKNQILQDSGQEPVPFDREALIKKYRGVPADKYLNDNLGPTHHRDAGNFARDRSDTMHAAVDKEVAYEKQRVDGKSEHEIWKGQAEKAAELGGFAIAELGDTDAKEPKALKGALDALDKSGAYGNVKDRFLKAVNARLRFATDEEADKFIKGVEQTSPTAANDIRESRKAA